MANASFQFLGFALAVVLAYHLHRSSAWRQVVLLAANLLFLASFLEGRWSYAPLAAFVILAYAGVLWIRAFPKSVGPLVVAITIAAFVWLKKYAFVPGSLFLAFPYVTVGLSYILFRVLHLMIDTSAGDLPDRIPAVSYFNYTLSFTTLVSGPIQLYQDYVKMQEAASAKRLDAPSALRSIERIVVGMFKVNILALLFSTWHARSLEALSLGGPVSGRVLHGAILIVSYPLFLYCNFSGYIDVVIGIAQLLGFTLPENFSRPFAADNFIEFWSRWHITLSNWLKTYVYNPLLMALMRRFPSASLETVWLAVALFVTFFLVGVWHGQTSEFVFFGFLQGFGVAVNRVYQIAMTKRMGRKRFKSLSASGIYVALARGLTFTYFTLTTLWFWSNWAQIGSIRASLGVAEPAVWLAIFAGSALALTIWEAIRTRALAVHMDGIPVVDSPYWRTAQSTALAVVVLVVTLLMNQSAPDIVYKAF
jgi:D-alanyl-lipoteichoic acid acyltransferase DltB (MBOAT superfamily)